MIERSHSVYESANPSTGFKILVDISRDITYNINVSNDTVNFRCIPERGIKKGLTNFRRIPERGIKKGSKMIPSSPFDGGFSLER